MTYGNTKREDWLSSKKTVATSTLWRHEYVPVSLSQLGERSSGATVSPEFRLFLHSTFFFVLDGWCSIVTPLDGRAPSPSSFFAWNKSCWCLFTIRADMTILAFQLVGSCWQLSVKIWRHLLQKHRKKAWTLTEKHSWEAFWKFLNDLWIMYFFVYF